MVACGEEQFYLIWPPVLALGLSIGATRLRQRRVLSFALCGAFASAVVMAVLYKPGLDLSRIYYGADTRATGLLLGAALAFLWSPAEKRCFSEIRHHRLSFPDQGRLRRRWGWTLPLLLDVVGCLALGALAWVCLHLGEFEPFLYRGGFALVGLTTVAVIMAAVHPYTSMGTRLLGWGPLRWIGLRSYGIYLWHWPVFMVTRLQLDLSLEGLPLLALRLGVTVALADLSYRFVETPIRRGALGYAWKKLCEVEGPQRWRLRLQCAGAVVPMLALLALLGVAVVYAKPPEKPSYLSTKRLHTEATSRDAGPTTTDEGDASAPGKAAPEAAAPPAVMRGRKAEVWARQSVDRRKGGSTAGRSAAPPVGPVTAVGDSVMLGAVDALQKYIPKLSIIDARGSRQIPEAIAVLRQLRVTGDLGEVVIVHMGDNGVVTDGQFDEMMRVLSGAREILVVNTTVPDGYQWAPNNKVLADGVARYPNKAVLVDWHGASAVHPEYFWDGLHLTPQGAEAYAGLIAAAYRSHGE